MEPDTNSRQTNGVSPRTGETMAEPTIDPKNMTSFMPSRVSSFVPYILPNSFWSLEYIAEIRRSGLPVDALYVSERTEMGYQERLKGWV